MFTTLELSLNLVAVTAVVGIIFGFTYTTGTWLAGKILR